MALCVALSASAAKQQQAQAQRQQQMSTWNRAVGACLEARGYTVR
jgi:hypothetical protein